MCAQQLDPILIVALVGWILALALDDIRHRRVRNWALLPVLGFALAARISGGWPGCELSLWDGLLGMGLGLVFWLPGYVLKRSGAGDVKLAMVIGLVLGATRAFEANLIGFLVLGAQALLFYALGRKGTRMPAVPALAIGFIAALLGGPWLLD